MKTTRIIIGCAFAAIALAINVTVVLQWMAQGAATSSLIAAVAFYTTILAGGWLAIDINIRNNPNK